MPAARAFHQQPVRRAFDRRHRLPDTADTSGRCASVWVYSLIHSRCFAISSILAPGFMQMVIASAFRRINKRPVLDGPPAASRRLDLRPLFEARRKRLLIHGPAGLLIRIHADP